MKILKKISAAVIVLVILAVPLIQTSGADTVNSTAKDMMPVFLSDVVGLDLTKYNMTHEAYTVSYPSFYGGLVKDEVISFTLESDNSTVRVMAIFDNGFIYGLVVRPVNCSIIYARQPSTNALDESRNILQRYKTFAENYGLETSHIDSATTMLNNTAKASTSSVDLYMLNNITGFVPSVTTADNIKQETKQKTITWIYTEKGVDMPHKCLSISFGSNKLFFADTWNLYIVGSLSVISEDEAKNIGWEAARNYNLTLVDENETLFSVTPKWSNVSTIALNMIPGQIYNRDPDDHFISGGNATRDPLALYPQWQMMFYFESIGGTNAIQVGVWGDTKEIAYISATGHLGTPGGNPDTATSTEPPVDDLEGNPTAPTIPSPDGLEGSLDITTPTEPSPESTQSENPTKSVSGNPPQNMYLIGGIAAATAIAIAVAAVALKKRRK